MSNLLNLADSINFNIATGKTPTFIYNGTTYEFSPAGLITFLAAAGSLPVEITASVAEINSAADIAYAAVTATANGLTTGLIANGVKRTTVTSSAATNAVTLPGIASNSLPIGYTIVGRVTANGCEMLTPATTNETINGTDSDGTNQIDLAANTGFFATVVSTTGWDVLPFASTVTPDND